MYMYISIFDKKLLTRSFKNVESLHSSMRHPPQRSFVRTHNTRIASKMIASSSGGEPIIYKHCF